MSMDDQVVLRVVLFLQGWSTLAVSLQCPSRSTSSQEHSGPLEVPTVCNLVLAVIGHQVWRPCRRHVQQVACLRWVVGGLPPVTITACRWWLPRRVGY